MKQIKRKRILSLFLCLILLTGLPSGQAFAAPEWPSGPSISAEGGILIDGNSGAVLYGKNIHEQYFPASITKILTALIILENCPMDDVVTFSHNAVYNVETNSSNANLEEGDRLTVLDCLYAMMLKSANEAANALAEHAAGSTEAFSTMMNAKALSLGCTDSHFNNPSGLNDPEHYTSAHDMALIAQAAFQNETFAQIVATLYYDLPPTKRNAEGLRIYPGHQMIKKNSPNYYAGVVGGKTGYTTIAGNTLVTCAKRGGLQLITVVLNGHQTHYTDTRAMLNFGFRNFRSVEIAEFDTTYTSVENDMTIAGLPVTDLSAIRVQEARRITLPLNAEFSDTTASISYELPPGAPEHAAARISYDYEGRTVGTAYLMVGRPKTEEMPSLAEVPSSEAEETPADGESSEEAEGGRMASGEPEVYSLEVEKNMADGESGEAAERVQGESLAEGAEGIYSQYVKTDPLAGVPADAARSEKSRQQGEMKKHFHIPVFVRILLAGALAAAAGWSMRCWFKNRREQESADRRLRYQRRQQRLQDIGVSSDEFQLLLKQKRTNDSSLRGSGRRPPKRRR